MYETLKRTLKANKLFFILLAITALFSNLIPFYLQADDEKDVFESTNNIGIVEVADHFIEDEPDVMVEGMTGIETEEEEEIFIYIEQRFIVENAWLFLNPGDDSPIGRVKGEMVWVVEEDGEWLKVVTENQEGWMDVNFVPSTEHLDELLEELGGVLSVHFENMETGFVYQFNEEYLYPSASVKKAVHGLYIYQQAELGYIDLDSTMWGSTCPSQSVREFVSRNIRVSCDHATFVLLDWFGILGYLDFITELGADPTLIGSWIINSHFTVDEVAIFARAIFEYIESDGIYSEEFRDHLLNNEYPFIVSDYPVASKTGWYPPFAWHDMAIVYAPSPYALIILSARHGWSDQDYEVFRIISMAFQEFNDMWFF